MEINYTDLVNYIVAIIPSVISVITVISSIFIAIKNFRKVVHDDVTDMKELKKEYKKLNQTTQAVLEENAELKRIILEQNKNFELIEMELHNVKEEQEQVQ